MLAVDGPIVMTSAPTGRCASIHWPTSRPAGRPPEPARNVAVDTGLIASQLGTARLTAAAVTTRAPAHRDVDCGSRRRRGTGTRRAVRAASSTATGAVTSRYW